MNYKSFISIIFIIALIGCDQSSTLNKNINISKEKQYRNYGFALIYSKNLDKIRELDGRSLNIYHKSLKNKSIVKITNPKNGKYLIAEVKSNRVKFSEFYNSVITNRIVEDLDLDLNEPYIKLALVSKNSTFVAKKAKTFDEEKKVAEKAPIDGILINDLNNKILKKKPKKDLIFSYSIKVADFYYKDTAKLMVDRIYNETYLKNSKIIELSKTKYRVLIGPFNDIKSIKETFEKMKTLNFDNLEILKNV